MNKLQEIKEAIKRTPPQRLKKIEYQSHMMQMVGVSIVCGIFIWKGFWWIILAFIFSLGISFTQGISAYQQYIALCQHLGPLKYNPKKDKSFTRQRDYYIKKSFGKYTWVIAALSSLYINLRFVPYETWWQIILFSLGFIFFYIVIYFFFFYAVVDLLGEGK